MVSRRRRSEGPVPLSQSIEQVAARLTKVDLLGFAAISEQWESIVGTPMAAHLRPLKLIGSTLMIAVDAPVWATQTRLSSSAILAALRERTDVAIDDLEVVVRTPEGPRT